VCHCKHPWLRRRRAIEEGTATCNPGRGVPRSQASPTEPQAQAFVAANPLAGKGGQEPPTWGLVATERLGSFAEGWPRIGTVQRSEFE